MVVFRFWNKVLILLYSKTPTLKEIKVGNFSDQSKLKSVKKYCTSKGFLVNIFLTKTYTAETKTSLESLLIDKYLKTFKS